MASVKGQIHDAVTRAILYAEGGVQIEFAPLAADDDWFVASTALTAGASQTTTVTSLTTAYCPGQPVVPVTVVAEGTGDTWTSVSVAVVGTDQFGDRRTDTVSATNSSGTWTATCSHAFESLTSVAVTVVGTGASGDTMIVGFAKTYGIGRKLGASGDVIASLFNGAADAGTVSAAYSTYAIAGTPDADDNLLLWVRPSHYMGV